MTSRELLAALVPVVPAAAALLVLVVPARFVGRAAALAALPSGVLALALAAAALADASDPVVGDWLVVDAAGGLLVGVIGLVGLASVLVSPTCLALGGGGCLVSPARKERIYYAALYAFWAILLAVPLAGSLGGAWLLVEATTAASALLVGFSGKPRALEAGWKYLVLTSLGLGVALLGMVLLAAQVPEGGLGALSWRSLAEHPGGDGALVAYLLLLAGLAAKIGWAPVHNWLPDAHSEAPPPVSALLSAALLPSVLLVAWRAQQSLAPVVGERTTQTVLVLFGLLSLGVAIPFLWRSLPWKRLLAYSSLEHMGVLALGIGFATPLALGGVVVHVAGHAVAKALGFYVAAPLLAADPRAGERAVRGTGRRRPALGATMGISLGALAGLPPSPLFVSEVLIVAGGFQAGRPWAAAAAALLLALGFLGLAHALLETAGGRARRRTDAVPGLRPVTALAGVAVVLLLALTAVAAWLPGSDVVEALARGLA